jgi:hypothetical protein
MINANGCICSPDGPTYKEFDCPKRKFDDGSGKKLFFTIHLKPETGMVSQSDKTLRIYLKWDDNSKRLCIGWIGKHPCTHKLDRTCKKPLPGCSYNIKEKKETKEVQEIYINKIINLKGGSLSKA